MKRKKSKNKIYNCKDTIFNDPKMTMASCVKGPNNMICREWVWKG